MALLLRRQYDLTTLVIGFELAGRQPMVRCTLERDRAGERAQLLDYTLDPAELGIPDRLDRSMSLFQGYPFSMPDSVLAALRAELDARLLPGEAVWLYLKSPVGYLALAPWEQILFPALARPVLRLPDFLVDPAQPAGEFNIVLCSSQPISEEAFASSEYMARMTRMILDQAARRTTVHLFTDGEMMADLTGRLMNYGVYDSRVILHNPQGAEPFAVPDRTSRITDPSGQLASPWLLWMRDALAGRSIDLVHLIAHGYLSGESAALSVAESPLENLDRKLPRFIGPNELGAFLAQTGAWGCALTSPLHNYSEMAHRLLVTTLANLRPGPILHHEMRLDPDLSALAAAYQLLLAARPTPPPVAPSLMLYCHPARVAPPLPEGGAAALYQLDDALLAEPDDTNRFVEELYTPEEEVPGWVSAAMRYIDQRTLEIAQQSEAAPGQAISTSRMAGLEQSDTLRKLQSIVEDEARSEASSRQGGGQ
ncbi:hypothetical protein [Caldilinea sp.]|uniref:hypothetical protein n=1 Tax=Caldilinea sp. TaxID=2293560 RepID=UPI002C385D7F|nr:hypothetical protein [Caldilinea sp.]